MATATSRSRERARSAEHNLPVPLTSLIRPHARAASGWRDAPPDASGDADRPGRGREDAPRGELARRQLPRRADGVWLVDLAAGPETSDVAAETARVLDVRTLRRTTDRVELDTFPRPGRRSLHRDSAVRFRSDGGPARVSRRKRLRRPGRLPIPGRSHSRWRWSSFRKAILRLRTSIRTSTRTTKFWRGLSMCESAGDGERSPSARGRRSSRASLISSETARTRSCAPCRSIVRP